MSAAFSTTPEMLIASRAVLGVAGAAVMPSVLALVTGIFADPKRRARALTIYLTAFMSRLTLGPLVGGLLLQAFWWGSVFLISVPGMLLLLASGPFLLPRRASRAPGRAGRLDIPSVVLSLVAVLLVVYGLKELARHGWEWAPAAAVVVGVAAGAVFAVRQRRLTHPLLDLHLFRIRTFRSALTLMFVTSMVGTGALLFVTQYLQEVVALTPLAAGALLVAPNVVMIVGNLATPFLARRIRTAPLVAGALVLAAGGYLAFGLAAATSSPLPIVVAMCLAMLGTGPLAALCNQLAMGAIPSDRAGSGASVVQTTNELGLGLGIVTIATLGMAVYRGGIEPALRAVPADAARAAQEGIDRAVDVAGRLTGDGGAALLAAARESFTAGLHVAGIVSAVLYLGLAVVALRAFAPERRPAPAEVARPGSRSGAASHVTVGAPHH